jgi:hypothetical protein
MVVPPKDLHRILGSEYVSPQHPWLLDNARHVAFLRMPKMPNFYSQR